MPLAPIQPSEASSPSAHGPLRQPAAPPAGHRKTLRSWGCPAPCSGPPAPDGARYRPSPQSPGPPCPPPSAPLPERPCDTDRTTPPRNPPAPGPRVLDDFVEQCGIHFQRLIHRRQLVLAFTALAQCPPGVSLECGSCVHNSCTLGSQACRTSAHPKAHYAIASARKMRRLAASPVNPLLLSVSRTMMPWMLWNS